VSEKGAGFEKELEIELPVWFTSVFVQRNTISEEYGNPWRTWIQMGRPRFPSRDKIEILKEVARPLVTTSRMESENGYIKLKIKLTKNEVSLFRVSEIQDESSTYIGLDDSKITSY
ncbi:MAG: GH39 family glycosyl hydrolase, partial [Bacteroidota bacterium]